MNEFELIAKLAQSLPTNDTVIAGVGDDCAVLDLGIAEHYLLFKTDAVVEGIHFDASAKPEQIGHKALGRCLSDIAAMGGTPNSALITLALPKDFDAAFLTGVYTGMGALAERHGVAIVGGETTTNPERMLLSVSVLGTVKKSQCVFRKGACAGDAIFVTGQLGGSRARKHLDFEPRLAEARWLTEHFSMHSLMDISDGLAGDLRHILTASGVGAELFAKTIPISRAAKEAPRQNANGKGALLAALTDGEDFELLFTVASRDAVPLLDAWKEKFPELLLSCIGRIVPTAGLTIRDANGVRPLDAHGYVHFQ